jgi:hypothetical protein
MHEKVSGCKILFLEFLRLRILNPANSKASGFGYAPLFFGSLNFIKKKPWFPFYYNLLLPQNQYTWNSLMPQFRYLLCILLLVFRIRHVGGFHSSVFNLVQITSCIQNVILKSDNKEFRAHLQYPTNVNMSNLVNCVTKIPIIYLTPKGSRPFLGPFLKFG